MLRLVAPNPTPFLARLRSRLLRLKMTRPAPRPSTPLVKHVPSPILAQFGARLAGSNSTLYTDSVHESTVVRVMESCAEQGHQALDTESARDVVPALLNFYMRDPAYLTNLDLDEERMYLAAYRTLNTLARDAIETTPVVIPAERIHLKGQGYVPAYMAFLRTLQMTGALSSNLALRTLSRSLCALQTISFEEAASMLSQTARFPRSG